VLFLAGVAFYVRESQAIDARVAVLEAQVEPARAGESIDQRLACALVELELLKEGYAGKGGINIGGFQCDGTLERTGDGAILRDVRFKNGSEGRLVVAACLARGARWSVKELREDGSCGPRPATSASAAPSRSAN
jgi:hypothetical protein